MPKFVDLLPPRKELTKRRDDAVKEIERIEKERIKCISRQGDTEKRLAEIDKQYSELRDQRQKFMIDEKDKEAEGVEKQLEQLEREEPRLKELQAGLVRVIGECGTFSARAVEALKVAEEQLGEFELYTLYDRYNEAAPVLAEVVKQIYNKRRAMGMETNGGMPDAGVTVQDREKGALNTIPRLRSREEVKNEGTTPDCRNGFFWYHWGWKQELASKNAFVVTPNPGAPVETDSENTRHYRPVEKRYDR
jgi:hypothetical protein